MTTEEKIKLIAEFDGWTLTGKTHPYNPELGPTFRKKGLIGVLWAERFKYDTSWDWLMPVVEKIEKLSFKWPGRQEDISVNVNICYDSCYMLADDNEEILFYSYEVDGVGKMKSTLDCVLQFVQWYNQNKK